MISISGKGIHSGEQCTVRIWRADGPVRFRRAGKDIPALPEYLGQANRATSLELDSVTRVTMVEHLLAALNITGWWHGLVIETSAEEVPILDGSAIEWLGLLPELGAPPAAPAPFVPQEPVVLRSGKGMASIEPGESLLDVRISFDHPLIGQQKWLAGRDRFGELADARTFGFLEEFELLKQRGLARGADADNCLVFTGDTVLKPARSSDEPVRHKALDVLGDLFVLGRPISGRITSACGSHELHARLVAEVRRSAGMETAT